MFEPYGFERTYFSMDDCFQAMYGTMAKKGPYGFLGSLNQTMTDCYKFLNGCLYRADYAGVTITPNDYLSNCWNKYIWPKFYNRTICFTDEQLTDDEEANNKIMFTAFADSLGPILAWMASSSEKYSLLIANQEANKDKLLGQIKSSSTQRFNDTPQNQGSFDDDKHNTSVTKSEAMTDGGTLLSRLNEIEDNLKRLYEDWSNEFRKFIFWSV